MSPGLVPYKDLQTNPNFDWLNPQLWWVKSDLFVAISICFNHQPLLEPGRLSSSPVRAWRIGSEMSRESKSAGCRGEKGWKRDACASGQRDHFFDFFFRFFLVILEENPWQFAGSMTLKKSDLDDTRVWGNSRKSIVLFVTPSTCFPLKMHRHGVGKPPATVLTARDCERMMSRTHIQQTGSVYLSIHVCTRLKLFTYTYVGAHRMRVCKEAAVEHWILNKDHQRATSRSIAQHRAACNWWTNFEPELPVTVTINLARNTEIFSMGETLGCIVDFLACIWAL